MPKPLNSNSIYHMYRPQAASCITEITAEFSDTGAAQWPFDESS